jgi:hypothetical protein
MPAQDCPGGALHSGKTGKSIVAFAVALFLMLVSGCATHSSVSGLPSNHADSVGRCPLGQAKVCQVGWPSRLKNNERSASCRCS